jgi:hypothetical protein
MNSPVACKNQLSSTNCAIKTAAGVYNFTDISNTPKMVISLSFLYILHLLPLLTTPPSFYPSLFENNSHLKFYFQLTEGSKRYKICLCGNSSSCNGISDISSASDGEVNLGKFRSLSVSSSTGGPKLSYYGGSSCPGHGKCIELHVGSRGLGSRGEEEGSVLIGIACTHLTFMLVHL